MVDVDKIKSDVSALDINGKLLLIGGGVGLISCFLEWYGSNMEMPMFGGRMSIAGIDSWNGKLVFLGLLLACGTFIHQTWGSVDDAKLALYPKLQLGGAGLAALGTAWFWLRRDSNALGGFEVGPSFGLYLTLLTSLAATWGAFQRFKASN